MTDCSACGAGPMVPFADLGEIPVFCGVHYASEAEAVSSPVGGMRLAYCPECAYVRNAAFDPAVMIYDTTMDTNLHHSPAFQAFSAELVARLNKHYNLADATVLDIGCGQGEFLRELCHTAGCRGYGFDAMYAGPTGDDASGAHFTAGYAPVEDARRLPSFDFVTSRHWFEHIDDPYGFLVALRERTDGRLVHGYFEVPDACYDLATAGWEVIYPHVSYFDSVSLARIFERAGWRVTETGTLFSGMFRYIEVATHGGAVQATSHGGAVQATTNGGAVQTATHGGADRRGALQRQLAAIAGFGQRQAAERERWLSAVTRLAAQGQRPVLWGAGSRGVQFLNLADPHHDLAAVVDVNPRKWGRFLPVTGHRVQAPAVLTALRPRTVIITNPAYRDEIGKSLAGLGVAAEILVA
jgi:SAM-dependent methyltransferase